MRITRAGALVTNRMMAYSAIHTFPDVGMGGARDKGNIMSRKHRKRKPQRPCFVFTGETITLTQEAMKLLAQVLAREEGQPVKVAFARETIQRVNRKLDVLATPVGARGLTTFDYNERIVLVAAIQLYILDLMSLPPHSQQTRHLRQCQQIVASFVPDQGEEPRPRSSKDHDD